MKKRITCICIAVLAILMLALPLAAFAEGAVPEAVAAPIEGTAIVDAPGINVGEPLTWTYLATIAGAATFTLLIVQFCKAPLDKLWKIPTRVFAYVIALAIMLVATAFTTGLTMDSVLLTAANAFLAAMSAYGAYEVTFAKGSKSKHLPL